MAPISINISILYCFFQHQLTQLMVEAVDRPSLNPVLLEVFSCFLVSVAKCLLTGEMLGHFK